jgi:hypothetical protein
LRSPDEAQRNPGRVLKDSPDFGASRLHPGYRMLELYRVGRMTGGRNFLSVLISGMSSGVLKKHPRFFWKREKLFMM